MSHKNVQQAIEIYIKLGIITLLIYFSFLLISPLLLLVVWGGIIAIGSFPIYKTLLKVFKGKDFLASLGVVIILVTGLGMIAWLFFHNAVFSIKSAADVIASESDFKKKALEFLDSIPYVNNYIETSKVTFVEDIDELLKTFGGQIKATGEYVLSMVIVFSTGLVQTLLSILLAGIFLYYRKGIKNVVDMLSKLLLGEYIEDASEVAVNTIRSVVNGILGVGVIQGLAAGIGYMVVGVPGVAILTTLTIFVAIIQLPPFLVLGPVSLYLFFTDSLAMAIGFLIWSILISVLDSPLKAILLGRGLDVPTFVVLLGAIGGLIAWGIIGLFIGAVTLTLGFKFIKALSTSLRKAAIEEGE